ncbi:MAG: pitrilysin family protein [bacterium]
MINRALKPISKSKPYFIIPKINISTINNGIKLFYVNKNTLPIVNFSLIIFAGSRIDPAKLNGLAYLTSTLIVEGAGEFNALELKEEFQSLGVSFNVNLNGEYIIFNILSTTENFEKAFSLLSDVILRPHFTSIDFDLAKKRLQTNLVHSQIDPDSITNICYNKVVANKLQSSHPKSGYPDTVENITNENIVNFYKDNFSPSNSVICVTGDIQQEEIENLYNKYFDKWENKSISNLVTPDFSNTNIAAFYTHFENAPQSIITLGHRLPTRDKIDYLTLSLANGVLGGHFSSRLNRNLREQKGYTYGIGSRATFNKECGIFTIDTSVEGKVTIDALAEIIYEINNFYNTITEEELDFNKSYLVNHFPATFETYSSINSLLVSLANYNIPVSYLDSFIDNTLSINIDSLNQFIKNFILPDKMQIYICGDKNNFIDKLPNLGLTQITELDVWGDPIKNT